MRRREYLALLGSGTVIPSVAGCTSIASGDDPPRRELTRVTTEITEGSAPVSLTADITSKEISSKHTAKIEIGLTWQGDHEETLKFGAGVPMALPSQSNNPKPGLNLVPPSFDVERVSDRCWTPKEPPAQLLKLSDRRFGPGETASQRAELWATRKHSNCIEPGEYTFSDIFNRQGRSMDAIHWNLHLKIEDK